MSDTFPDETLYPVLEALADEDRLFASNSAAGHESSQIKGSTIKGLINALKGTPPETLDTLAKLASAINDDPAFHTTLATALAGKAPLESPDLTGTPKAPTAAKGTNTTQIASTEYVYSNYKQTCSYTQGGSTTVNPAVPGKLYSFTGAGTLVLPVASTVPDGSIIDVFCQSTVATVTISSATRILSISGATSYSFSLAGYGNTVRFQSIYADGSGQYYWMALFDPVRAIELAKVSPALTGTPTAPTAAAGTNTTQLATTEFVQAALTGASGVPAGVICMWSGTIATIPTGWALCDGANGTPDLVDRFVVAAGSKAGGDKYDPGDTGGLDSVTLDLTQIPAHTHAGTTAGGGAHTHDVAYWNGSSGPNPMIDKRDAAAGSGGENPNWYATDWHYGHDHAFTTDSKGGGGSHENRPPYYALAFIMKL